MLYGEHATCQAEAEYPELWRGLVGAWSPCLSPRGGSVLRDLSGRGNHGTLTNMDQATDWVTSGGRGALDFDGSNGYVTIGSPASLNMNGLLSIVCWFYPATVSPGSFGRGLVSQFDASANLAQFSFEINRTAAKLSSLANGENVALTSTTALSANTLYQAVLTRSGGTGSWTHRIYVNAIADGEATTAFNPHAQQSLSIGRQGAWSNASYSGLILDARIANRVMTPSDIALDYRLGPGGWATPRRRRWNYATAQTAIPYWVFARKNARLIGGGVT